MKFAIKKGGEWYVAKKVKANNYGEPRPNGLNIPADTDVWSELRSTAFLGVVGNEDKSVELGD